MKVTLKDAGTCRKTMTVEVPAEKVNEERVELLNYYAKGVVIPGFRKGKAPKALVEKKYAKEMAEDLKDRVIPKFYQAAIAAEDVKVVSVVDVSEPVIAEGLSFEVTVDVPPEFKLPKYQGIAIKAEKTDVEDKDVDETVQSILRQHASHEDVEGRAAAEKDMVQVSYESTIDGQPLEELVPAARGMGKGKGYWITCDDESFIPDMGMALIGSSIGDKKDVPVEFPADFIVKELGGKKAQFSVEVTGMREMKLPAFDEEFLKKLHVESEEELRKNIRTHLEEAAENKETRRREDEVCEFLIKKTKMDVPESSVKQATRNVMYELARQRMMAGMSQQQISEQQGELMDEAKVKADEQVRLRFIVEAIANAEEIAVTDDAVEEEIVRMAVQQQRDASEFRRELEKEDNLDAVAEQLRFGKTIEFLLENAKIK